MEHSVCCYEHREDEFMAMQCSLGLSPLLEEKDMPRGSGELPLEMRPRKKVGVDHFYTGQWRGARREGQGMMERSDGSTYKGEWQEDEPCGLGEERLPDSSYDGDFFRGKRHGEGTCNFVDGRMYVGQWEGGHMHGEGKLTWPEGMIYEGQFMLDKKSGVGCFSWPDGRHYEGQWAKGKQHGRGTYTDSKGIQWTGRWECGRRCRESVVVDDAGSLSVDSDSTMASSGVGLGPSSLSLGSPSTCSLGSSTG
uniref:MORN repeat-containing protein 5 n=1 Tax=Noctiluca scintillans TaxID=2966 RepID=A0A7S1AFP0_NOCSC